MDHTERFENSQWHGATPRFVRRSLRTLAKDALILLLVLGVVEAGLRIAEVLDVPLTREVVQMRQMLANPHVNRFGFRDDDFEHQDLAGQSTVIAIGNSTTFGTGVRWDQTYAQQTNQLIQANTLGPEYRVINGAGQAASLEKMIARLEEHVPKIQPKMVVLGFSAGIVARQELRGAAPTHSVVRSKTAATQSTWLREIRRAPLNLHKFLFDYSISYHALDQYVRMALFRSGIMREPLDKPHGAIMAYGFDVPGVSDKRLEKIESYYESVGEDLARVKGLVESYGGELVVLGIPARFMVSDEGFDNRRHVDKERIRIDPLERAEQMTRSYGIKFIDLKSRLAAARQEMLAGQREWDDLYVQNDFVHLNEEGHRIAARAVYEQITRRDLTGVLASARRPRPEFVER